MTAGTPDTGSEAQAATAGLGQRLLRRATAPGVSRPGLAARIQRRSFAGRDGLSAAAQRRWAPSAAAAWGYGSALPYFGFGFGAAVEAGPARAVPTARTVGAAAASPAAQALSGLGSSLQRRHLGEHGGREGRAIQRRAMASSPAPKTAETAPPRPLTPDPSPIPSRPPGEGRHLPLEMQVSSSPTLRGPRSQGPVQRLAATPPPKSSVSLLPSEAEMGPAIVRRGAGSPRAGGAGLPVQAIAETPRGVHPTLQMEAAIVHRAARGNPVQRAPLARTSAGPVQMRRAAVPDVRSAGSELLSPPGRSFGGSARPEPETAAGFGFPVQRLKPASLSAATAGLSMPLLRSGPPAGPGSSSTGSAVIQRIETPPGALAPAEERPIEKEQSSMGMRTNDPAPDGKIDLDDVVERVMRRLTQSLTVESERRGGRRWL